MLKRTLSILAISAGLGWAQTLEGATPQNANDTFLPLVVWLMIAQLVGTFGFFGLVKLGEAVVRTFRHRPVAVPIPSAAAFRP